MADYKLIFPDWLGEFGWEVMTWQCACRKKARESGLPPSDILVRSFEGMGSLYQDFATFESHGKTGRILNFKPKVYRPDGVYIRFGNPPITDFPVLFHARDHVGKIAKNTPHEVWELIASEYLNRSASIGSVNDYHIPGTADLRGIPLERLMQHMAGAVVVVGQSSGPMHLAALCGASLIVWGDMRTYFGESLEKRYKETWNPFKVPVKYVYTGLDWQPDPEQVKPLIRRGIGMDEEKSKREGIRKELIENINAAIESGQFFITVSYFNQKKEDTLSHWYGRVDFPAEEMIGVLKHLMKEVKKKEKGARPVLKEAEEGKVKWG